MKFKVHKFDAEDLTIHEATEQIDTDDIIAELDDFYRTRVTKYVIWDLHNGGDPDLSTDDMQRIIRYSRDKDSVRPNGKSAIVTNNDRYYGLSRMFEIYAEMAPDLPLVFRVFRTIDEAKRWLYDGD